MHEIGSRVFAVRNADEKTVYVYGRGVYAGDHPRPGSGNWSEEQKATTAALIRKSDEEGAVPEWWSAFLEKRVTEGTLTREEADARIASKRARFEKLQGTPMEERVTALLRALDSNPRIDLDNGSTVWGFQCWWGPEAGFEEWVAGREVVEVPAPEAA